MKIKLGPVVIFFFLMVDPCTQAQQAKRQNDLQARIQGIATSFLAGSVESIEILQIPSRILTRSAITPEMLERSFYYKLVIQDPASGPYKDKLQDALGSMSVKGKAEMKDVRWGVLFYAKNGRRVGSPYFNMNGTYGAVDGRPASFRGDFFKWLESSFTGCFR